MGQTQALLAPDLGIGSRLLPPRAWLEFANGPQLHGVVGWAALQKAYASPSPETP